MENENNNAVANIDTDNSNETTPTKVDEVFTANETTVLEHTTNIRTKLINDIISKNENSIHSDPELIQALNSVMNSQDSQALSKAKLRQKAKENESDSETLKALITATLRAVKKQQDSFTGVTNGREKRHVDVDIKEDQTSTQVKQFTIKELEDNVKSKANIQPEDIVKE